MPPVAAAGAAIASSAAAAGITASGIATGLTVVGTGLGLVGQITGNNTLSKIGLGIGTAGAATGLASSLSSAASGASAMSGQKKGISGDTKKTTRLLDVDNIEEGLSSNIKGVKSTGDLKNFKPVDTDSTSMDAFRDSSRSIGEGVRNMNVNGAQNDQSFWNKAGNTLQRYDTTANMLLGAGRAYMQNQTVEAQKEMQQRGFDFDRELINRREANLSVPGAPQVRRPRLTRTPGDPRTAGILQQNRGY